MLSATWVLLLYICLFFDFPFCFPCDVVECFALPFPVVHVDGQFAQSSSGILGRVSLDPFCPIYVHSDHQAIVQGCAAAVCAGTAWRKIMDVNRVSRKKKTPALTLYNNSRCGNITNINKQDGRTLFGTKNIIIMNFPVSH